MKQLIHENKRGLETGRDPWSESSSRTLLQTHVAQYHSTSTLQWTGQLHIHCESKKSPPLKFWHFPPNGWEFLVQILHAHCTFQSTLDYKFLLYYLQLWWSYAILSATTIMCPKCPPSTETHAGWSHLICHNFITVGDNWIKICSLAQIGTHNRHVKFGRKIPNRFGKTATKPQGGDFLTHTVQLATVLNCFPSLKVKAKKVKAAYCCSSWDETHLRATRRHLSCKIT